MGAAALKHAAGFLTISPAWVQRPPAAVHCAAAWSSSDLFHPMLHCEAPVWCCTKDMDFDFGECCGLFFSSNHPVMSTDACVHSRSCPFTAPIAKKLQKKKEKKKPHKFCELSNTQTNESSRTLSWTYRSSILRTEVLRLLCHPNVCRNWRRSKQLCKLFRTLSRVESSERERERERGLVVKLELGVYLSWQKPWLLELNWTHTCCCKNNNNSNNNNNNNSLIVLLRKQQQEEQLSFYKKILAGRTTTAQQEPPNKQLEFVTTAQQQQQQQQTIA